MTDHAYELGRPAIRDAMDRLIAGKALHSDGKLTIKSLAEETRVKTLAAYTPGCYTPPHRPAG